MWNSPERVSESGSTLEQIETLRVRLFPPDVSTKGLIKTKGLGSPAHGLDRLYPQEINRVNANLPKPLKVAYKEASACFKSKAYTATAIMCRKTLEGICVEHGTKGRNLNSSLKELKDKGIIENRLYEWANALRISGNEAAHDVNITISAEDAGDILEFTNALLEYIFTFRDRFEDFKKRRAK